MTTILRRDARILAFLGLAIAIANFAVLQSDDAWVRPHGYLLFGLQLVAWIGGALVAAAILLRDVLEGTTAFLIHRPIGRRRLFDAMVFAGAVTLVAATVIPIAIAALIGPILRPHPADSVAFVWTYAGSASVGLAMFGAVAFALSLPMAWPWRGLAALAFGFSLVGIASMLSIAPTPSEAASLPVFVVVMLAIAATSVAFARHLVATSADADRPLGGAALAAAMVAIASVVAGATVGIAAIQDGIASEVGLPRVSIDESGTVTAETVPLGERWREVWSWRSQWRDDWHSQTRRGDFDTADFFGARRRLSGEQTFQSMFRSGLMHVAYLDEDRRVRVHPPFWHREGRLRILGRGTEAEPFADDARATPLDAEHALIVFEPSRGELWRWPLGSDAGAFAPLPLPDGDRAVGVARRRLADGSAAVNVVVGRDRVYAIHDGVIRAWSDGRTPIGRPIATTVAFDPVAPRVRVTDADGVVRFDEVVEATGPVPSVFAAITLVRPPLSTWASLFATERSIYIGRNPFHPVALVEPLVAGGKRAWLVALHSVVGLLLAFWTWRRLARLGASGTRRLAWALFVFAGGIIAFALHILVETSRAHADPVADAADAEAPAMLLRSA